MLGKVWSFHELCRNRFVNHYNALVVLTLAVLDVHFVSLGAGSRRAAQAEVTQC